MKIEAKIFLKGIIGHDEIVPLITFLEEEELFPLIKDMRNDHSADVYGMGGIVHPEAWKVEFIYCE